MLEVADEFFNDEDGNCLEAEDMDGSWEETDSHSLESNKIMTARVLFPKTERLWKRVSWMKRGHVGQAINKYHCAPSLYAI